METVPKRASIIRAVVLERLVLQNLKRVVAYAQEDEFVRRVMENKTAVQRAEQEQAKRNGDLVLEGDYRPKWIVELSRTLSS